MFTGISIPQSLCLSLVGGLACVDHLAGTHKVSLLTLKGSNGKKMNAMMSPSQVPHTSTRD